MNIICHLKKIQQKYKYKNVTIGVNSRICLGTILAICHNIKIGDNTYINGGMIVAGANSKIVIGDNCLNSYNVNIRTNSHYYKNKNILIKDQGNLEKDIIIDNDVLIGFGVQIIPGVIIGDGAVLAAGTVVTKDVPDYSVYGGIPARKIVERINYV